MRVFVECFLEIASLGRVMLGSVGVSVGVKKFVQRSGGILAHILEDVGVPSEGHRRVAEWPSILETVWAGTPYRKTRVPAV